jgi:hypothetical protein
VIGGLDCIPNVAPQCRASAERGAPSHSHPLAPPAAARRCPYCRRQADLCVHAGRATRSLTSSVFKCVCVCVPCAHVCSSGRQGVRACVRVMVCMYLPQREHCNPTSTCAAAAWEPMMRTEDAHVAVAAYGSGAAHASRCGPLAQRVAYRARAHRSRRACLDACHSCAADGTGTRTARARSRAMSGTARTRPPHPDSRRQHVRRRGGARCCSLCRASLRVATPRASTREGGRGERPTAHTRER